MDGAVPRPIVQEAPSEDNGGKMRVRVPFYVGESVSRAPGFDKKVYFPKSLLPSVVQEGKAQIAEGRQPLTVYARHAHATSGTDFPVGKVVDMEQEGRLGYAVLEIAPTEGATGGKNVQTLIQAGHLNAVSLRSGAGRFELQEKKVNGELMLQAARLAIDGIDFAPDSPAMPTYGIEVLAAEASVADPPRFRRGRARSEHRRTSTRMSEDLTATIVRAEYPEVAREIEAPLRDQNKSLTAENAGLKEQIEKLEGELSGLRAEAVKRERDEYVDELANRFPEPEKAKAVLAEMAAEYQTKDEVARGLKPVMVLLQHSLQAEREPEKPLADKLLELFPRSGSGRTLTQERRDEPVDDGIERIMGLQVPTA
jgi:hypothetical protein